jgi:hypothetical protein
MKHPGRGRLGREFPMTPSEAAWRRFRAAYCRPFFERWPDRSDGASYMLDIVADAIFDPDALTFRTTDKNAVFPQFLEPFEEDDGSSVIRTPEDADAALSVLVLHEMVVTDSDMISIHPRFADVMADPLTTDDGSMSQGLPHS